MIRRVHVPAERIRAGRALLTPEARHYLRDVLRLAPGAPVEIFDGQGGVYRAAFADGEALAVGERRPVPPPGAQVWLAFALPRGGKADLVVQKATELGAARLLPWTARRSAVRLDPARARERARRWRRIAAEASRQCGRADVPRVDEPAPLSSVAAAAPEGFTRLLFHAGGGPLAARPGAPGHLALVGPEGGLEPGELDACLSAGFRMVGLGPRVLRAETAAIAAAAVLQFAAGDLGGTDVPQP